MPNTPGPGEVESVEVPQRRSKRFTALLLGALLLLLATAAFLVVQARHTIWTTAEKDTLNVAKGLEEGITARLDQSVYSLRALANDFSQRPDPCKNSATSTKLLNNVLRVDPVSVQLGIRCKSGDHHQLWRTTSDLGPTGHAQLDTLAPEPGGTIAVADVLLAKTGQPGYVALAVAGRGEVAAVYSLIPVSALTKGAEGLHTLPGGILAVIASDGRRLLRYSPETGALSVNQASVTAASKAKMAASATGTYQAYSPLSKQEQLVGFSQSPSVPLVVVATVNTASLYQAWWQVLAAPLGALLIGTLGVALFGRRLQTALQTLHQRATALKYMAEHDSLTHMLNRDAFIQEVSRHVELHPNHSFAVLVLDVAHFKDINDTLGHAAGDTALREIAQRMKALAETQTSIRCVARVGGNELGLLTDAPTTEASRKALRTLVFDALGTPMHVDAVELELTAQAGYALYPEHGLTAADLMRCADIALHHGKQELQDFCPYAESLDNFSTEMLALRTEFVRALRDNELTLVYQPKVCVHEGQLVGVEALTRWTHPVKGPISPAVFVPLVESGQLVQEFTAWVLSAALKQVSAWRTQGYEVPVAVNVSVNNLLDASFHQVVADQLAQNQLPAELLELEITETAVMRHPEQVLKRLQELRDLGVRLSIDDFGTGYASLSYLKRLPVQTLKIDKSFVAHVDTDAADQKIVRAAVGLAHEFGMTVVAEGVERLEAQEVLKDLACDYVQGYLHSKPVAAQAITNNWLVPNAKR